MNKENKQYCDQNHPDNSKELPRLKKIAGQINGIQKMRRIKEHVLRFYNN